MNEIIITKESGLYNDPLINHAFRLRHDTFISRLNWEIPSNNGMERDDFDDLLPYHIVVKNAEGSADGCWRALPTTGRYMLKDVFPQLLQGEAAPQQNDIWEISRFAVRKGCAESAHGYMNSVTVDMVRSFYNFAIRNDVNAFVTVTTVACERLLRQLGVECRRFGEAKAIKIGVEKSVALWINVSDPLNIKTH